jgi:hypothetical protein
VLAARTHTRGTPPSPFMYMYIHIGSPQLGGGGRAPRPEKLIITVECFSPLPHRPSTVHTRVMHSRQACLTRSDDIDACLQALSLDEFGARMAAAAVSLAFL